MSELLLFERVGMVRIGEQAILLVKIAPVIPVLAIAAALQPNEPSLDEWREYVGPKGHGGRERRHEDAPYWMRDLGRKPRHQQRPHLFTRDRTLGGRHDRAPAVLAAE